MTRGAACRDQPVTAALCVDAEVQELNEMTIGRTDDPENPFRAAAFEAASLLGAGSRTPSGPADMAPRHKDPMRGERGQITVSAVTTL